MSGDVLNAFTSTSFDLTESVTLDDSRPYAFGGFADIWLGWYTNPSGNREKVAIKRLRVRNHDEDTNRLVKYLGKELRVWKCLNHPNILPLYGLTHKLGATLPAMVCPWQEHGSLSQYLELAGDKMSTEERYDILLQTIRGLQYLHNSSVIHGDLTGSNVLISRDKQVYLSDFGLSRIKRDSSSSSYGTSSTLSVPGGAGAVRWAAPELFLPDDQGQLSAVSFAGDIYSFGSVWLQVLSGHIPYHQLKNEVAVILQLSKGERPPRPTVQCLTNDIWDFLQRCWSTEPHLRPKISDVAQEVERCAAVDVISNVTKDLTDLQSKVDYFQKAKPHPPISSSPPVRFAENNPDLFRPLSSPHSLRSRVHKLRQSFKSRLSRHSGPPSTNPTLLEQIGVPEYQGYIQRKRAQSSNFGGHWRTCYLILKAKHLYRLGSHGLQEKLLKGYTNLDGYQVIVEGSGSPPPTEFQLFKPGDSVQYFRSTDPNVTQNWIRALRDAIVSQSDSSSNEDFHFHS